MYIYIYGVHIYDDSQMNGKERKKERKKVSPAESNQPLQLEINWPPTAHHKRKPIMILTHFPYMEFSSSPNNNFSGSITNVKSFFELDG